VFFSAIPQKPPESRNKSGRKKGAGYVDQPDISLHPINQPAPLSLVIYRYLDLASTPSLSKKKRKNALSGDSTIDVSFSVKDFR
jgi:hypothetical protein